MFQWARMHKDERDRLVGSDDFDLSLNRNGLPHVFSPEMVIARREARKWLLQQPNAPLIFFSFDRTMNMIVARDLKVGWKIGDDGVFTDEEADAFNDLTQQQARLEEAWHCKITEEYLKASDQEVAKVWSKILRVCQSWGGSDDRQ